MVNKNHSTSSKAETSKSSDPMVKFVVEEFERYEKFHQARFDDAKKVIDHWENKAPARAQTWMNAVHVPITFAAEQTITPRLFAALFPNEAPVDVATFGAFPDEVGRKIKFLIQQHFRTSDVQGEVMPALSQNTLLGTGYIESPWKYTYGWTLKDNERVEVVTESRPDCKSVNFFEMFPHPAKIHMKDSLPIVRRRFCNAEYIKTLGENPSVETSNIAAALNSESPSGEKTNILDKDGQNFMEKKKRDEYELLEYWGGWDMSYVKDGKVVTKRAVPHWIIIVNREVKLVGVPNPFQHQRPPYCKVTLFPDQKPNWFGVGIGCAGAPTQERLNKLVNQRLDNVDLVLNKQGCYNGNDPLINVKRLQVAAPGKWHKVSDTVNSLKWMDTPDVTASSYKEEELAKSDYREATGATVPLMPTDQGQHRTAAGISLLQGAAGVRFRPVLRKMETDLVSDLAQIYLSNLQQFMIAPEWVQATTPEGAKENMKITPMDIRARVKFIPTGVSETINKEVQIGQLMRFKEITVNDRTINQAELNRMIGELMGFKDLEKLVVNQQPVRQGLGQLSPEIQQYIQQRMAEGASPEQIQLELQGNPPMPGGGSGSAQVGREGDRGQTPEIGQPVSGPGGQGQQGQNAMSGGY